MFTVVLCVYRRSLPKKKFRTGFGTTPHTLPNGGNGGGTGRVRHRDVMVGRGLGAKVFGNQQRRQSGYGQTVVCN